MMKFRLVYHVMSRNGRAVRVNLPPHASVAEGFRFVVDRMM